MTAPKHPDRDYSRDNLDEIGKQPTLFEVPRDNPLSLASPPAGDLKIVTGEMAEDSPRVGVDETLEFGQGELRPETESLHSVGRSVLANVAPDVGAYSRLNRLLYSGQRKPRRIRPDTGSSVDPEGDRYNNKKAELLELITDLDREYIPVTKRDIAIYELWQAMNIVLMAVGENDKVIRASLVESVGVYTGTKDPIPKKNIFTLYYDALRLLETAFKTVRGNEDLQEQFMTLNCPSSMWKDPELKELAIAGINKTYELLEQYSLNLEEDQEELGQPFINRLQDICASEVYKYAGHGESKGSKHNAREYTHKNVVKAQLWWKEVLHPPDKPDDEHLLSA